MKARATVAAAVPGAVAAAVLGALGLQARAAIAQEVVDLPAEDRFLSPDLELVYRIGSADAVAEWSQFSSIPSLGFDSAGNLHVMDRTGGMRGEARIVVVDPAGGLGAEFGRSGDGPGEFRLPRQMIVWPDGATLVEDIMHMGYHVFAPGGAFERMVRNEAGSAMRPERTGGRTVIGGSWDSSADNRPILRVDLSADETKSRTLVEAWAPRELEARSHQVQDIEDMVRAVWGFEPGLPVRRATVGRGRVLGLVGLRDQAGRPVRGGVAHPAPAHSAAAGHGGHEASRARTPNRAGARRIGQRDGVAVATGGCDAERAA